MDKSNKNWRLNKNKSLDLSVIIITKNEEKNIDECIKSLFREIKNINSEIILVDSASKDKTVELAQKYDIKIVILDDTKALCPSAGRYIGTIHSRGKYLFFIDGDMIVHKDWIQKAMDEFINKEIGGLCGNLLFVDYNSNVYENQTDKTCRKMKSLGGAAIYCREALEKSGTFNPFLMGEEERELGYRIRMNNFILEKINFPMAYHVTKKQSLDEMYEKSSYFTGIGQILRRYKFDEISLDVVRSHKNIFFQQIIILILASALFLMLFFGLFLHAIIGILLISIFGKIIGYKKTSLFLINRMLTIIYFIIGIFTGLKDPNQYNQKGTIL